MKNFRLNISLKGTDIRRTLLLPCGYGFFDLHNIIQMLFGWNDECVYEFHTAKHTVVDDGDETGIENMICSCIDLTEVLRNERTVTYVYDLDDDLTLVIEAADLDVEGAEYPVLVAADGAMLYENCDVKSAVLRGEPADIDAINAELERTYKKY